MQFVVRSKCPSLLVDNKAQWTASWISHYRWEGSISDSDEAKQPKKPSDNYWLDDDIRLPLIEDFHNNCGYCGESLPTPKSIDQQDKERASKGDVDHFLPKAIYPELVYEWTNYIWSCKPCNQLKKEFYSLNYPLLNPCCEEDCMKLIFIEDTGQYALQTIVSSDKNWRERLKNSEQKTMLNADEIQQKRRLRISTLRQRFASIANYLIMIDQLQIQNTQLTVVNALQGQIASNIVEIKEIITCPEFYFLLQKQYKILLEDYPQVAALL